MLRRLHRRSPKLSLAATAVAAIATVSCGGTMDGETVSGSSKVNRTADPVALASDPGTLTASGEVGKVPVCHKGADRLIPGDAVPDHLGHGDTFGECGSPISCPCFSATDIEAVKTCSSPTYSCTPGDLYFLSVGCEGSVAQSYFSWESEGVCGGSLGGGTVDSVQHLACVYEITATGCS